MKLKTKFAALALALSLLMTIIMPAGALAASDKAMIAASGAYVYANSRLEGKSVKIKGYTLVDLEDISDGVAQITYKKTTCYLEAKYIMEIDTSEGEEKQIAKNTVVYQYPSLSSRSVKIKKDMQVNLVAVNGSCAIIESDGNMAYVPTSALKEVEKKPEIVYDTFEAIVVADSLNVYSGISKNAKKLGKLAKDELVTVTAYTSDIAQIEYNGVDAYCQLDGLTKYKKPAPTIDEIFGNPDYTNEQKIYHYLTGIDGFSTAAACGILANIKCESGFRPEAYNPSGGSYGICQWLGGRYTSLKNYCSDNGLDYTSLKGQCLFLSYELKNKYSSVYNYIKSVDNSAQGAYDAAYHWCYYYEIPANRGSVSVTRGNMARDDFWPKYN